MNYFEPQGWGAVLCPYGLYLKLCSFHSLMHFKVFNLTETEQECVNITISPQIQTLHFKYCLDLKDQTKGFFKQNFDIAPDF